MLPLQVFALVVFAERQGGKYLPRVEQFLLLFCIFLESGQNLTLALHIVCWVFLKNTMVMHCELLSALQPHSHPAQLM